MGSAPEYWLTRLMLQRGLALIYLIGFLVAVNQFRPLCGERGLLPAPQFMRETPFREAPSIFYLFPNDHAFAIFGWIGVLLAVVALSGFSERFGQWVSVAVWALMWVIYLCFVNIGQTFYGFGWESMMLESGFLAIFLGSADVPPQAIVIWLFRWVLFRVMFGAGLIKLRGDPCWRDFTCLNYHFETQPMPNPLSWYFHWLPEWVHKAGIGFNHLAELVAPFLSFAPQPVAAIAGATMILFQASIMVSGNFSWLSLLTIILGFSTFSDAQLSRVLPITLPQMVSPPQIHVAAIYVLAVLVIILSIKPVLNLISSRQIMNTSYSPLQLVNTYGAFGSITRERFEIVIEGTEDAVPTAGTKWKEYEFKGKPGDPAKMPPQIAPYHLRIDWLMWFAAMPSLYYDPWFIHLLERLLQGDQPTLGLLKGNPFPTAPPRLVRALHYRYRFTTPEERQRTGLWWHRELAGIYFPPVSLNSADFQKLLRQLGYD
ncbi:lipase maturation factor family protein [Geomonas sp.]|uniref:lipase maturation factor family protein n=1 Tax=Geomonas sp. TaxID=2651584 RepID=UPI002B47A161|nr:lipase maturation factor family protein [Geomonas sp.]HJV35046.1 lipase maturation factor family protein [Geomonas sp.]